MKTNLHLKKQPVRTRSLRSVPRYPRASVLACFTLLLAGCPRMVDHARPVPERPASDPNSSYAKPPGTTHEGSGESPTQPFAVAPSKTDAQPEQMLPPPGAPPMPFDAGRP